MATPVSLDTLNAASQDDFVAVLGGIFEHSPWIAAQAWQARPFEHVAQLHQAMSTVMYAATSDQHLALIRAHPDLAGKAAMAGELTPSSSNEQASAGLDRLSPAEYARFTALNQAYRDQFDVPFIICVREHTRQSILTQFEIRLGNTHAAEIQTALGEIAKIARLRLDDLVSEN